MSENDKSDTILSLNWNCERMIKASREGVFVVPAQPDGGWHFCIILVFLERNLATRKRTVKLAPLDSTGDLVYLRDEVNRGIKWQAPWRGAHGHVPLSSAVRNSQWPSIPAGGDPAKPVIYARYQRNYAQWVMGKISEKRLPDDTHSLMPAVGMVWAQG